MTQQARELLDRALAWMFANMRSVEGESRFTYFPPEMVNTRSGWCYGDPGVASVLLKVAAAAGDVSCRPTAISVACQAAQPPIARSGVGDATLCHGASGLGHIFNRLHQATNEPILEEAAKMWFAKALAMRRPGEGIGGFLNWWPEIQKWSPEPGVLVGSAGIGLALLSSIYPIEPLWDTPFLLPRPESLQ